MISFATLFLGLVLGTLAVEVVVDEDVAAVEYLLNGSRVARLEAPPWRADVILSDLGPHELKAVSYDALGEELDHARQWVNLPRPPAEGRILLEGGKDGRGVTARLLWESSAAEKPAAAHVTFDGRELEIGDPQQFVLPDHDPARLHYVRAELEFDLESGGSIFSAVDVTFGGWFTDRAEGHEMAMPILLARGAAAPSTEALQGRIIETGAPVPVLAIEKGPAEVVLVRDKAVQPVFDDLALGPVHQYVASLRKDQTLRLLLPFSRSDARAAFHYDLFPVSAYLTPREGGIFWHLLAVRPSSRPLADQRLADAVAVAGMISSARGHRRAVVLLIADGPADASLFSPQAVRNYLAALRVPLLVWRVGELSHATRDAWGPGRDVSDLGRLERAAGELSRLLDRQRIVWLEGRRLPQRLELAPGLPAVTLAD